MIKRGKNLKTKGNVSWNLRNKRKLYLWGIIDSEIKIIAILTS